MPEVKFECTYYLDEANNLVRMVGNFNGEEFSLTPGELMKALPRYLRVQQEELVRTTGLSQEELEEVVSSFEFQNAIEEASKSIYSGEFLKQCQMLVDLANIIKEGI